MIHLDTSFLIRSLAPGSHEDAVLRRWLRTGESLAVGAIGWTEFLCGPVASAAVEAALELVGDPAPYGAGEATLAARIFNETGRRRGSLVDCMIAASAIAVDATLATSDLTHFRRLEPLGLRLASLDA